MSACRLFLSPLLLHSTGLYLHTARFASFPPDPSGVLNPASHRSSTCFAEPNNPAGASLGQGHWPPGASSLTDHDLLLWVGDLNYRLAPSAISDADARAAIRAGRLAPLLAADQLGREMAAGRVFRVGTSGWVVYWVIVVSVGRGV